MNLGVPLDGVADPAVDAGLTAAVLTPAVVSVIVALLTTAVTITTLALRSRDERRMRQHETRLRMLDRRLEALEGAWMATFTYEREGVPPSNPDHVVRMSIWMPAELQGTFVRLFTTPAPTQTEFASVRTLLKKELENLTS